MDPFTDDIWTVTRRQRFYGLETGARTTFVRLSDGGLFVHCPVSLDATLRREVDALGPVRAAVAASLYHHLYVGAWQAAYPEASYHACPGLEAKRPDLRWDGIPGDTAPRPGRRTSIRRASPRASSARSCSSTGGRAR